MYCSGAGIRGRRGDDDRVVHRPELAQLLDDRDHRRFLLADGDVDADDAGALLIDDGVESDGRLAGLAVADDQLALTAADGDHAVDRLDAGLQRLVHRLAGRDARRLVLQGTPVRRLDVAEAVQGAPQRIDDAADHRFTAGHR